MLKQLNVFLNKLDDRNIYYSLEKVREEAIMVEVCVSGERWEIEFMEDGTIELEKFVSDGEYYNIKEVEHLLNYFDEKEQSE